MTPDGLPEPLTPSEVDIRGMSWFKLNVERLFASELVAVGTPEECWGALMLWCRAWQQHPAGSLPNDDRVIAGFSQAGARWPKIKETAMRGFVLCSDGRLYHPVVVESVLSAWRERKSYRKDQERLEKWRDKKRSERLGLPVETPVETHFTGISEPVLKPLLKQVERERESSKKEPPTVDASASMPDARTMLFRDGLMTLKHMTGKPDAGCRTLIGRWLKAAKDDCGAVHREIAQAAEDRRAEPVAWLEACFTKTRPKSNAELFAEHLGMTTPDTPHFDMEGFAE